ncbi:MAG: YggT family protein [Defluviitaleaceae bacterium]|nr:YggT family protein [Defluviitaleaceae bacterium]
MKFVLIDSIRYFVFVIRILLFARAILSWFILASPGIARSPIIRIIYTFVEPILYPVRLLLRKLFRTRQMPLDLAALIVFWLIGIVGDFLINLIWILL